ncbi:MAG: SDR family oxidoreductase [Tepidisphaeraceae bacterium]|jgi:nucleoside-diphosphate-sugar epimerase
MKVLITGNMAYVGSVLVPSLAAALPGIELIGFDNAYFGHCLTTATADPDRALAVQHFGDLREFPAEILDGVDAVVHLAAVSNDPMGKTFEAVTEQINIRASVRLAELAKAHGVRHFVFASSCSVYGAAADGARTEKDSLDPLTAYARSKVAVEQALRGLADGKMSATCLRFATACGMSPRLRLDLVLNDFVACALASGEITVLSDGSPWRPLIDVGDMARAIGWAIQRPADRGGNYLIVNAGAEQWNYQVRDLAGAVAQKVPGCAVHINSAAPPDRRSYRVDFSLFRELAPRHQPVATLPGTIDGLIEGLRAIGFADRNFRESNLIRLHTLKQHIAAGRLNSELVWRNP